MLQLYLSKWVCVATDVCVCVCVLLMMRFLISIAHQVATTNNFAHEEPTDHLKGHQRV